MEPLTGIEPVASTLPRISTPRTTRRRPGELAFVNEVRVVDKGPYANDTLTKGAAQ